MSEWEYEEMLKDSVDEVIEQLYLIKDECNWLDEKVIELAKKQKMLK
jgi:hypothetical protein